MSQFESVRGNQNTASIASPCAYKCCGGSSCNSGIQTRSANEIRPMPHDISLLFRTIRERLKDSVLLEGVHYIRHDV
jgi:hypothetical protein